METSRISEEKRRNTTENILGQIYEGGGLRDATASEYRDKSILFDVTYAGPQAGVHMRAGSADRNRSAASTSEARKRNHYGTLVRDRLYDLQDILDKLMHSLPQLCQNLSPLKTGFIVSVRRLIDTALLTLVQATL